MKKLILIAVFFVLICAVKAQVSFFNVSQVGTVVLPDGTDVVRVTFSFTYTSNFNMNYMITYNKNGQLIEGIGYRAETYSIDFPVGTHTIQFQCRSRSLEATLVQEHVRTVTVKVKANFQYDFGPGTMTINGTNRNTPYDLLGFQGDGYSAQAINQQSGEYFRNFHRWTGGNSGFSNAISGNLSNVNIELMANTKRSCNVSVASNKEGGWVKINGVQSSYPGSLSSIIEGTSVTLEAQQSYTLQGVQFQFQNWSDGNSSISRTVTVNSHTNLSAIYKGTPIWESRSMGSPSQLNQNIELTWSEHPNSGVTGYEIWRIAGRNNPPAQLIGSVGRGTTSYTDTEYVVSNSSNAVPLQYDIRAVYSPDNTITMTHFQTINFGVVAADRKDDKEEMQMEMKEIKTEIMNYPDPFNPSTTIKYSIAEAGKVNIRVYDITGKEIKVLVDEYKERGEYSIQFNAGNLSSGIYLYRMIAPNYINTKKMILVK